MGEVAAGNQTEIGTDLFNKSCLVICHLEKTTDMDQPEQFSLKWGEFEETMSGGLRELRAAQQLEDVTLVVEGGELKAHRVVLASCSPFFSSDPGFLQPSSTPVVP